MVVTRRKKPQPKKLLNYKQRLLSYKKSEPYGIEIEWNKLTGDDISALSSYKRNIDAKIEKLQPTLEKTRVEISLLWYK